MNDSSGKRPSAPLPVPIPRKPASDPPTADPSRLAATAPSTAEPRRTLTGPAAPGSPAAEKALVAFLANVFFAQPLEESGRLEMARAMETIEVPMGGMIFNQGDPADALFVVRSGVIEIVRDAGLPTSRRLATLSEKEYFGEMGIIERAPRSASARAAVRSTLLKLSRETAVNLFRKHPSIELRLRTAILRRHSENIAGMARKK